ncbi:hypothetical protein [Winogradskyella sediminis]|uniref:hypothetical protein n=1 Tax=Winogradskyella sediminis TaxID=1382466 RepID=UPI003AA8AC74
MKSLVKSLLVGILFFSCSAAEENNSPNDEIINLKFLTSVIDSGLQAQVGEYYYPDTILYENGKPKSAIFYQVSGLKYQFEYGSNGKVSTAYSLGSQNIEDLSDDISTVGSHYRKIEYTYDSNDRFIRLDSYVYEGENYYFERYQKFDYDDQNRVYRFTEANYYEEVPDVIIATGFDENGNVISDSDGYTYEFDDSPNPLYILFKEFGITNIETGTSLEYGIDFLHKNNLVRVTNIDDEIIYSVHYTYDEDNYPITADPSDSFSIEYYSY